MWGSLNIVSNKDLLDDQSDYYCGLEVANGLNYAGVNPQAPVTIPEYTVDSFGNPCLPQQLAQLNLQEKFSIETF